MTASFDEMISHQYRSMNTRSGVGKTCLVLRWTNDQFMSTFITTIGIDYKTKALNYKGQKIGMAVWDTAGQERFRSITSSYIRGAHGIILVYDVTDENSFNNIHVWLTTIMNNTDEDMIKVLIANKCDMERDRKVTREQGEMIAKEFNMTFLEASAKSGKNVHKAFETMGHLVVDSLEAGENSNSSKTSNASAGKVNIGSKVDAPGSKSGCC